jgi:hypothetical protein
LLELNETRERSAASPQGWRKIAVLGLAVAVVGLPINDLLGYGLLVVAAVVVWTGAVAGSAGRWMAAALIAGGAIAAHLLLPAPRIEEGHNIFLGEGRGGSDGAGLPRDVLTVMTAEFSAQYPSDGCGPGCARVPPGTTIGTFGFSADAIFDHPLYSRRVRGIDFSDPAALRLGASNEGIYNWIDGTSDIRRLDRDRKSWQIFNRLHLTLPLFVMYRFPQAFAGSDLCWRGEVLWEGADGRFALTDHPKMACRRLTGDDAGRRIFALSIKRDAPLAMALEPSLTIRLRDAIEDGITVLGVAAVILLLVRWRWRALLPLLGLLAGALLVIALNDPLFIGGFRPLDGGDDGLVFEAFGRGIVRDLIDGHWWAALMGGEGVYYFAPGMRYFRAFERFMFGDTFLGYLSAVLALPFLVHALFRRFLPASWALGFILIFVALPIRALFGSTFALYVKAASRGYADPLAFAAILGGLVLIVPRPNEDMRLRLLKPCFGTMLLAGAVLLRPNLVLASGVLFAAALLSAVRRRQGAVAAALGLGFASVLLLALHNWVFGRVVVLLASNTVAAMRTPPSAYVAALGELIHGDILGQQVRIVTDQVLQYLSGALGLLAMVPVHLAAIVILLRVGLFGARYDFWLRAIALAALLEHGVGLCYLIYDRYYLLTWLLTMLVCLVWLRVDGFGLARRHFSALYERCSALALVRRLSAAIERLRVLCGLGEGWGGGTTAHWQ